MVEWGSFPTPPPPPPLAADPKSVLLKWWEVNGKVAVAEGRGSTLTTLVEAGMWETGVERGPREEERRQQERSLRPDKAGA